MPFTVRDFQGLLRLLERQPAWKDALRASLLGEEFLELPALVRDLGRAQRATNRQIRALTKAQAAAEERLEQAITQLTTVQAETEHRIRELVEAQARTEERVGRLEEAVERLVEAQARTEERVGRLEEAVERLVEAQARTEERLEALAQAQTQTEQTVRSLVETMGALGRDVSRLKGDSLERMYRDRASSFFQDILRRIRLMDHQQVGLLLDDAVDAGRISREERADVLRADVVVSGVWDGQEVYLLAEVSATVTAQDIERARRRAAILERATGRSVLAAVAGERLSEDPQTQQQARSVWKVLDGRAEPPS
ncbi:MAG: hypothetical protein QN172_06515 [Armatimonadota bacterium]|nr:hypothetical protein [Armatimonadota bacterium]MDR7567339.1 hypothetical protein [Armatimonadota bacterium]MDR7602096.1 hypothetical protein [Armatimonadota bacterium]